MFAQEFWRLDLVVAVMTLLSAVVEVCEVL